MWPVAAYGGTMPEHLRTRWPARPTVVLAIVTALSLVVALWLVDRPAPAGPSAAPSASTAPLPSPSRTSPSPAATLTDDPGPGVVAAALNDVEAVEQPGTTWVRLADCESGEWDADGVPVRGSADWDYGTADDVRFEGGLHFEPSTWDAFRDPGMAEHAGEAGPVAQVVVAERVLDAQGWSAWPVCSRKLGLR